MTINRIEKDEAFRKLTEIEANLYISNYGRLFNADHQKIIVPNLIFGKYYHVLSDFNKKFKEPSTYDTALMVWTAAEIKIPNPDNNKWMSVNENKSLIGKVKSFFADIKKRFY
jgi:hypothetical protein